MFPYRSLAVERFEHWMDAQCGLPAPIAGEGARPPPATEVERGSLQRARQRLVQRIPVLCGLLGQRIPVLGHGDLTSFWQAVRLIGRSIDILLELARSFKVSLLGDYSSFSANWQRAKVLA